MVFRYQFISEHFNGSKIECYQTLSYRCPPGPVVALASFPGSGNTWLRHLVQQTTGIYTGSVYNDKDLKQNGFPAEEVVNGSVILVKTHMQGIQARKPFSHAVLLVRSPEQAALAEFNRRNGGHVGYADPVKFVVGKDWSNYIQSVESEWYNFYMDWIKNFHGPKYVIFYENLLTNTERELRSLLNFLNFTISEFDLNCTLAKKEGHYHRRPQPLSFNPFNHNMRDALKKKQILLYQTIASNISSASAPPI